MTLFHLNINNSPRRGVQNADDNKYSERGDLVPRSVWPEFLKDSKVYKDIPEIVTSAKETGDIGRRRR